MAAQVQKLSYDEFKVEMRSSLRDRGVVDSLKSQVRASLVQELQAKSLGGARPQGPTPGTPPARPNRSLYNELGIGSLTMA